MKKTITLIIMFLLTVTLAYAATDSGNIAVTATIATGTPSATFGVYTTKADPDNPGRLVLDFDLPSATSMAFTSWSVVQKGTGANAKPVQWTSSRYWGVVAWASGMGRRYYIKSLATGSFVYGANTLPVGSFACIPVYSSQDRWDRTDPGSAQGGIDMQGPTGATLAPTFAAISGTAQTVYTSETPGSDRIIQVWYGFPPYNTDGSLPYATYAPIPTTQTSGTYSGVTVKVSITQ